LVESTLVLLLFLAMLLGVLDVGQILFAHQSLVERVRAAARWGALHPQDGPERVVNYVLYGQPDVPAMATPGFLGLTEENVRAEFHKPAELLPDDHVLHIEIVNYHVRMFLPWSEEGLLSPRPVFVTAPVRPAAAE
jgi:hypothetical protein